MSEEEDEGVGIMSDPAFMRLHGYLFDFVMIFPVLSNNDRKSAGQDWAAQNGASMKNLLLSMADGGLETKMYYSVDSDEVFVLIRATTVRLKIEAVRQGYMLQLDRYMLKDQCHLGVVVDGVRTSKPIIIDDPERFSALDPYEYIYCPYKSDQRLQVLYKTYGKIKSPFRSVDRLKLIKSILINSKSMHGGCGIQVAECIEHGCMKGFFSLHDTEEKELLRDYWLRFDYLAGGMPFEMIRDYFGEKITMYYVWLAHYMNWLLVASAIGIAVQAFVYSEETPDASVVPYYGIVMCVWSTLYIESWKRRNSTVAMEWGMTDYESREQDRPEFKGEQIKDFIRGDRFKITYFEPKLASRHKTIAWTVVGSMIIFVIFLSFSILEFKDWSMQAPRNGTIVFPWAPDQPAGGQIAGIMNAVQIGVMDMIFQTMAEFLNDFMNHRTETLYEDSLILMVFTFQFVNSFFSLFFIAFLKPQAFCMVLPKTGQPSCIFELYTQLTALFITRLVSGNIMELLVPFIKRKLGERAQAADAAESGKDLSPAERQFLLKDYETKGLQCFDDFSEMAIQFGFVTLFVTSFPLAPVLALLNNYIEVRVDAYKLLNECRRPEPKGAQDIGSWGVIMGLMSTASVLTNAALTCFTCTRLLGPDATLREKMTALVLMEHLLLAFKKGLEIAVPDQSMEVTWQLKRGEHILSKVVSLQVDDDEDEQIEDDSLNLKINARDSQMGSNNGGSTRGTGVGLGGVSGASETSEIARLDLDEEEEGGWEDQLGDSELRRRPMSAHENRLRADDNWDGDKEGAADQPPVRGSGREKQTMTAADYKTLAGAFEDFDNPPAAGFGLETDDGKALAREVALEVDI
jgi:anoctamin-10/anoctamin-7